MVGKTVGKYRVIERVGRGGMGIVYRAVDETLDRHVAIKVLNSEFGDAAVLKRFRAEAITLARLNHPGIATIYELNRQEDELMMVMEFVRGETLHQFADRVGPVDPPHAAHLCMQVLDALSHAHAAGVIHRDLKPANLMVTETGSVKVMDFGIARVLGAENYTLGGLTMGTPAFMSPEQVTGQPIDARSDLYAVGVVFYRLLSGRLPFVADTAIAMAQKQISDQHTPLAEIRPELPQWCSAIVDRALSKDPSLRFQSADEFRVALASAVVPQSIGELPTLAIPTLGAGYLRASAARTADAALESDAMALPAAAPSKEPTGATQPTAPAETTNTADRAATDRMGTSTTVVLGRSHIFALGSLILGLTVGIIVLGVLMYRGAFFTTVEVPPPPANASPAPTAPTPTPEVASPPPIPAPSTADLPATSPGAARASPPSATAKPPASGVAAGQTPAVESSTIPPSPAPPTPPEATPPAAPAEPPTAALPTVAFTNVRHLVSDGDRTRERRGMLRVGSDSIVMSEGNDSTVLAQVGGLRGIHYARSRHPRWRDAAGSEVAPKIDLGRFGFFRGDRNWFILLTDGEPVILSVEDPQLRSVFDALQTRTGLTIQRFR